MAHTIHHKERLLNRARRIRGQIEGIERALAEEKDCTAILQTVAACRGAMNGLMCEIVEGHIREHVLDPKEPPSSQRHRAAEDLIEIVQTYLK